MMLDCQQEKHYNFTGYVHVGLPTEKHFDFTDYMHAGLLCACWTVNKGTATISLVTCITSISFKKKNLDLCHAIIQKQS